MNTNANLSMMNQWLAEATQRLTNAGIDTPRLNCLVLLEDMTGKDRSWLLAHPESELTNEQVTGLTKQVERLVTHEPLAYIRGKSEFYGREFIINASVLQPRPESETMVDLLKQIVGPSAKGDGLRIVDIGTGSGALAITAKIELPQLAVIGVDIDPKCIKIAKQNTKKHAVQITFLQGDLLQPILALSPSPLVLLCNMPYVPDDYRINDSAKWEPSLALFGGEDGLDLYRRLFEQTAQLKQRPLFILTESLPSQHKTLLQIAQNNGYNLKQANDFIQAFTLEEPNSNNQ